MNRNEKTARILVLFLCLVFLTGALSLNFTFSGNPEAPDATAVYTRNKLTWDIPTNESGTADLNLFGAPAPGEQYPTIDPSSGDKYYLRLKNDAIGKISYYLYLYCENKDSIPLAFNVTETPDMETIDPSKYPEMLSAYQVLTAKSGDIAARSLKDFEIDWRWVSTSDANDTQFGNLAVGKDLLYKINALVIIEDNTLYGNNGGGGGGGGGTGSTGSTGAVTMYHRLYMHGYPEGDFRPRSGISRAETAAIFARILANYDESVMTSTSTSFNDVPSDKWYSKYIAFLDGKDVISGYPDGSFKPDKKITRAEFAAICVRYYENTLGTITPAQTEFADLSGEHWVYEYIEKANAQEWILGFPDNTVRPDIAISRAEVVAIVNRILQRSADKKYVDENLDKLKYFSDVTDKKYWAYYEIYEAANDHYYRITENNESWFDNE